MEFVNVEEFIKNLYDALEVEGSLNLDTELDELQEYDSLGKVSIAAMISSKYAVEVTYEDFGKFQKVKDIIACVEEKLNAS